MGQVNITLLTTGQQGVDAPDINGLVTPLQTEINGKLDNSNIAANAAIACTKTNGSFGTVNISTSSGDITTATGDITATAGNLVVGGTANITGAVTMGAFATFPTTPEEAPDADYEVANKKYVDDKGFGAYETTDASQVGGTGATLDEDTWYTANKDGIVTVGFTDQNNNSIELIARIDTNGGTTADHILKNNHESGSANPSTIALTFPVKKGYGWRFEFINSGSITASEKIFTPLS
jgi:hypothetical protein